MCKYYNSNKDNQFIEDYEERIAFLKGAVLHNCPLSLFCKNLKCNFHYYTKRNFNQKNHQDWVGLLEKYGVFLNVFGYDGENNIKNLSPYNWHTVEAKVIYFIIKNKDRSKLIKSASEVFSLTRGQIHKIQNDYNSQSTNYLALSTSKENLDGYRNYTAVLEQCGIGIHFDKETMQDQLIKYKNLMQGDKYNISVENHESEGGILCGQIIY